MTPGQKKKFQMQNPKNMVVSKTDLAKARNSWAEKPYIVSKGAQYSFREYANEVDAAWTADSNQFNEKYFTDSIAILIIFKTVEKMVSAQPWYQGSYRANIVTYSLALFHRLLSRHYPSFQLDLQIIWNKQSVPHAVEVALLPVTKAVYDALTSNDRLVENVTQWCKNIRCWDSIKAINIDLPDDIRNVLIENDRNKKAERAAKKDQKFILGVEAQEKVLMYSGQQWAEISKFAVSRRLVGPSDIKALNTASHIPGKLPNSVECNRLLAILDKVKGEGYKIDS